MYTAYNSGTTANVYYDTSSVIVDFPSEFIMKEKEMEVIVAEKNDRILILEDSEFRIESMWNYLHRGATRARIVEVASTAADCIERLQNKDYNVLFLDHDLGGNIFVNSGEENTGMDVVKWLVENKKDIEVIVVHSFNPPAADEMVLKLEDAGYENIIKRAVDDWMIVESGTVADFYKRYYCDK